MFLVLALLLLIFLPSPWNLAGALASSLVGAAEVLFWERRLRSKPVQTGHEALVGATGEVVAPLAPLGQVRVKGELWQAHSSTPIERGARVEVVAIDDLRLEVRPAGSDAGHASPAGAAGLLVVVVLALAACGGDDSGASEDYANGVCSSLSTWVTDVQETVQSLTDAGLATTREDLQASWDETRDATETLVDDLEQLGPPETEDGERVKSELDELGTTLTQQLDAIEQALDSGGGVTAVAAEVSTAISAAANAVETTYRDLQELDPAGELRQAFEDSDDCNELEDQLDEIGSD
jgi:membrane protein implicated in regulation of membrane protease activity